MSVKRFLPREVFVSLLNKKIREKVIKEIGGEVLYIPFLNPYILFSVKNEKFALTGFLDVGISAFSFLFKLYKVDKDFSFRETLLFPEFDSKNIKLPWVISSKEELKRILEITFAPNDSFENIFINNFLNNFESKGLTWNNYMTNVIESYIEYEENRFDLWLNDISNIFINLLRK